MTNSEMNTLIEQFLKTNSVTNLPQSKNQKHNLPTFGNSFKIRGGMSRSLIG